jgi:hypothetical protein
MYRPWRTFSSSARRSDDQGAPVEGGQLPADRVQNRAQRPAHIAPDFTMRNTQYTKHVAHLAWLRLFPAHSPSMIWHIDN